MEKLLKKQKKGTVSIEGYKKSSPDRYNEFNIIPSNKITMKNVPHKVLGIDDTGSQQIMYPGMEYEFPGNYVAEIPMFQNGGDPDENYYKSSATLAYYKERLNNKLKNKNPKAYGNYFKGLGDLRLKGKQDEALKYVQDTQYNEYLSPGEIQKELGDEYEQYLNSLRTVNQYNVRQGKQPLYGTEEGDADVTNLNYGRRFASLMVTPSITKKNRSSGASYSRDYVYDPKNGVNYTEQGDLSLSPFRKYGGDIEKYTNGGFGNPFDRNKASEALNNPFLGNSNPGAVARFDGESFGNNTQGNPNKLNTFLGKTNNVLAKGASNMMDAANDPFSPQNIIGSIHSVANYFGNKKQNKLDQLRLSEEGMTDNFYAVDETTDRGDYVTTGAGYGMFRPDRVGAKSPYGMFQYGGGIISDEMNSVPSFLGNTSTREMISEMPIPVPEFATIPVGLAPRESFEKVSYNPDTKVNITDSTRFAYNYYVNEKKLPAHIAAGIVGNLYQESGLKPGAVETTNTANGRGIAQWDKRDRWKGYLNWANQNGLNAFDLTSQLDYVLNEPGESAKALEKLKNTTTPEQAAYIFGKLYERPSEKHANWNTRTSVAKRLHSGNFKDGGEYELSDAEILDLKNQGYDIEFI